MTTIEYLKIPAHYRNDLRIPYRSIIYWNNVFIYRTDKGLIQSPNGIYWLDFGDKKNSTINLKYIYEHN